MSTSSRRSSTSHSNSQSRRTVHGPGPWRSPSTSSLFRGSNGGRGSPISVGKGAPSVGSTAAPSLGTAAPSVGVAVPITATAELSMVTAQPEISVNNSDSRSIRSARGSIFSGNGDSASGSASRNGSTSARESVERVVRRSASNLSRVSVHSHGHGSANGYGYGGSRNGTGSASRSTSRTGSGRVSDTLRRDRPSTAYLKDREAIEKLEERLESLTGDQHLTAAERVIQETLEDAATAARPYHHHHQGQQYDSGFDSPASAPPDLQRQEVPTMSSDSTATGSGITTPTTTATTTATTPTSDKEDIHKEAKEAITSASSDAVKMGTEAITSLDHAAAGSSSSMATTSTASLPQALASSSTTTTTTTTATAAPSSSTEGVSATPTSLATPASATSASAPAPSSTSTRPKSSSWFASFGRSKGRSAKMDFDSVDSSRSSHNGSGSGSGGSGGGDRVEGPQQAQSSSTSTTYQKPSASTSTVYQKPSVAKDEGEDEEDYPPMISITDAFPAPQQIVSPVEASFGAPPAPTSASTPVSQSSPASSTEPRAVHSSPAPTSTHPPSAPTSTHPPSVPAPALEPTRSPPAQATKSAPMRTPPPKKRSWFYSSTPSSSSNSSTPSVGSPLARVVYSSSTGGVSSEDVIDGIGANEGSGGRDRGVSLCMDVNDGSGGGGGVSGAALVDALEDLSASVATIVPTRRAVDETAIPSISTSALVATTAEDATTDATTAGGTNATTTTAVTMVDTMTTATMADTAEDTSTSSKMSIRIPHPSENLPSALPSSIDDRVPSLPSTPAGTATTGGGLFGLVVPYFGVGRKSGGVTGKEKEKEEGKGKDGSARKQDEPAIESDEPSSFKASSGPDHHPSNSRSATDSTCTSTSTSTCTSTSTSTSTRNQKDVASTTLAASDANSSSSAAIAGANVIVDASEAHANSKNVNASSDSVLKNSNSNVNEVSGTKSNLNSGPEADPTTRSIAGDGKSDPDAWSATGNGNGRVEDGEGASGSASGSGSSGLSGSGCGSGSGDVATAPATMSDGKEGDSEETGGRESGVTTCASTTTTTTSTWWAYVGWGGSTSASASGSGSGLEEKDSSIQSEGHTGQEELGAGTTSQADSTSTMKTNPYPDSSELSGLPSSEPSDLASQSQSEQPTSTAPPLTSQVSGSAKEAELEDDDAKEVKLKENGAKEGKLKDNTDEKDTVSVKDKDRNRDRVGFGFGFGLPGLGLGVSAAKGSVDVKKQDVTKEKKKQENVHEEEEEKVNVNANEEKEKEASSSSGGASSGRGRGRGGAVSVDETPIMADGKGSVDGGLSGEGESPRDGNDVANAGDMPNEGNGTAKTTGGSDGEREALGQGGEGKAVGEEGVDATGKAEGVEAGDGSSSESGTNGGGGVIAWISPWAWYYTGTTTTTTTTTTTDEGPTTLPSTSPSSAPETESSSGSNGGRTASEGLTLPEENGNKGDGSGDRNKVGDDRDGGEGEEGTRGESPSNASATASSQDPKEGSKKDDGVEGGDGARAGVESLGETNPIEASIQANRSGWASFFSSRALMVKAIGYGSEPAKKEDEVKRDEHGAEIMDIDESDDEGQGSTLGGGDDGAKGDQEKDKKDVSSLVVATTKALIPQLPIKSSSASTKSSKSDSSKDVKPEPPAEKPAPPLTRDEDLKDKVTDSVPTTKPGSKPSSGKSTPVPVSPSKSTMNKDSPKEKEKARSAPVTPKRNNSPAPSTKKAGPPPPPNLVLPTWDDIFHTPPRSVVPPPPPLSRSNSSSEDSSPGPSTSTILGKTMKFVSGVLFSKDDHQSQQQSHQRARSSSQVRRGSTSGNRHSSSSRPTNSSRLRRSSSGVGGVGGPLDLGTLLEQERQKRFERFGEELPKAWKVLHNGTIGSGGSPAPIEGVEVGLGDTSANTGVNATIGTRVPGLGDSQGQAIHDVLRGCRRVVVIGVHGWFPGAVMRTVLGEPTGTSSKFANMMEQALREFEDAHGVQLEKVTKIPLEGEGTIQRRVERLYSNLLANSEWMGDLHEADAVIVATHSQGSVVSTHLLDRLIADKHIRPSVEPIEVSGADSFPSAVGVNVSPGRKPQRVCCLALCGIHLGPLRYLSGSSLVQPYIQYFESTAARELFEFQNTESAVSKAYVQALRNVLHHGVKMVYIASLNDQVVPIYSGIFTAASHPMILRALYIDGDAYHSSDFLSNLLVLLLRLRNSGIPDGGLIAHLSEATAGSLSGIGHSTAYEELSCYSLAVRYLFEANDGLAPYPDLQLESFDAAHEQNDYEIPWSLRDVIADERVIHYFSKEVSQLRDAFREWQPKTTILRDLKRKLQPIQRLPSSFSSTIYSTTSKL